MASIYWNLLSRRPANVHTGFASFPMDETFNTSTFYVQTIYWTIGFSAISLLIPILLKSLCAEYWNNLEKSKKIEFPSIIITIIHHSYVVPIAIKWIYEDFTTSDNDYGLRDSATKEALIAPFCLGYFFADTFFYVLQQLIIGKFEMFIHHFLFVYLVLSALFASGEINKLIPHLLICDSTGLIFNTCTILRTLGFRDHLTVVIMEYLFGLFFLLFRSVNMPLSFLVMFLHFDHNSLGLAQYVVPLICMLQWFWMYKIFVMVIFGKSDKPKKDKQNVE
jgi:hypothetical protein